MLRNVGIALLCLMLLSGLVPEPAKPVDALPLLHTKEETLEIHRLQSRWYWLESEYKTTQFNDRYNVIRMSIWKDQMRETENELAAYDVCYHPATKDWIRCND